MYIEGYPVVFNAKTVLYEIDGVKYSEQISPRAFDGADMSGCVLRYNHSEQSYITAAVQNSSLILQPDSKGLRMRAKLANTTAGRDLYEMLKTSLLTKMSFAFVTAADDYDKATHTRTIKKIKMLADVSIVDRPAYPQTSVYIVEDPITRKYIDDMPKLKAAKDEYERIEINDAINRCLAIGKK